MLRTLAGVVLGFAAAIGIALLATSAADAVWPSTAARTGGSAAWFVWLLIVGLAHLVGGFTGGRILRLLTVSPTPSSRVLLLAAVLAVGLLQLIGDWGHPSRFWTQMALLAVALLGVLWGSSVARSVNDVSEPPSVVGGRQPTSRPI